MATLEPSLEFHTDVSMQDSDAPGLMLFNLVPKPMTSLNCRQARTSRSCTYKKVKIETIDATGKSVTNAALKIDCDQRVALELQTPLLTFGSDPQQCNVVLDERHASPVHCKIFAQLNSGPDVWVLEDSSTNGTSYTTGDLQGANDIEKIHRCSRGVQNLRHIIVGPYSFHCRPPENETEILERKRWFQRHEPLPVTASILNGQLNGRDAQWETLRKIGSGGFGTVYKVMEKQTGLMLAMKEQKVKDEAPVRREILNMITLRHPCLVECIDSSSTPSGTEGEVIWNLFMPLYRGSVVDNLARMGLKSKIKALEQMTEGIRYIHSQGKLHRDIKPDNIFIANANPGHFVIGDLGLMTAMDDPRGGGTRLYAAPECYYNHYRPTAAIDIYALGVSFFVMLDFERFRQLGQVHWSKIFRQRSAPQFPRLIAQMIAFQPEARPELGVITRCLSTQQDLPESVIARPIFPPLQIAQDKSLDLLTGIGMVFPPPSYEESEAFQELVFSKDKGKACQGRSLVPELECAASPVLAPGPARGLKKQSERNHLQPPVRECGPLEIVHQARGVAWPRRQHVAQAPTRRIAQEPLTMRDLAFEVQQPLRRGALAKARRPPETSSPVPEQPSSKSSIQSVDFIDNHPEPNNIFGDIQRLQKELADKKMEIYKLRAAHQKQLLLRHHHPHHKVPGEWSSSARFSRSGSFSHAPSSPLDQTSSTPMLEAPHRDQRNRISKPARQSRQYAYREEVRQETLSFGLKIFNSVSWVSGRLWRWYKGTETS